MALNTTDYSLTTLLESTPYRLAYSLPLILVSFVLTFAGAFLTLDRSRTFAPRITSTAVSTRSHAPNRVQIFMRRFLLLEGGLGGLASGYAFGVYFVTFLSLVVPNERGTPQLSSKAFLAVWVLAAIICTLLAGRWKYAALFFTGVSGYTLLALAICVIVHPSLITRVALVSVFLLVGTVLCLLPLARYQHLFVRIGASASGAFGVVTCISLLVGISAWGNVWERLWVSDGAGWGTNAEKGLSAAYCLLFLSGTACDWFLRYKLGENPDEKWDNYLAEYTTSLPNSADRAGTFAPLTSFWSRHFGPGDAHLSTDIIYPVDVDLKQPIPSPIRLQKYRRNSQGFQSSAPVIPLPTETPQFLRKFRAKGHRAKRGRETIKFSPLHVDDFSSSDEDCEEKPSAIMRTVSRTDSSVTLTNLDQRSKDSSTNTLDVDKEKLRISQAKSHFQIDDEFSAPDYSDYEEDVTSGKIDELASRDSQTWTPSFIRRHSTKLAETPSREAHAVGPRIGTTAIDRSQPWPAASSDASPTPAFASVPATPSLIRAVERVSAAQQAAYSPSGPPSIPTASALQGSPTANDASHPQWRSFWQDVKVKAGRR